ncbi:MAG: hypothetical protein MNPFHGCM_02317 [Gemmatimonadaceae bacterium]|nr:hypothetical protein [Gemmatimonadaceae bacterium]
MSLWTDIRGRLDGILNRARRDRETAEEMRFHLEMEAAQLERAGVPHPEALRRARLAFGNDDDVREGVREARGAATFDELRGDVAYAFRQMRRAPGFALTVVATLALGIGASTAIYSVVDRVLLRPLPFRDADRLVVVWETDRKSQTAREPSSYPDVVDFRERSRALSTIAEFVATDMSLAFPDDQPLRLAGVATSDKYFQLTGLRPLIGRTFSAAESNAGGPRVAVLAEWLWRSRFAGSPDAIGQTIDVDDVRYEVIGVVPSDGDFGIDQINERAAYHAPYSGEGEVGVWIPLQASAEQFPRSNHPFLVLGRLASASTVPSAQSELTGIAADLERTYRNDNADRGVFVEPLGDVVFGASRPLLYLLLCAVGLLMLVAVVNVANLLLARGTTRMREIAIRSALGATTRRVGRQLLVESLTLGIVGGAIGIGCAVLLLQSLLSLAPADIPRLNEVRIDARLAWAAVAASLAIGVAFGSVPMWQARRVDVVHALKGEAVATGGGRRRTPRELFVVAAVALSVMLSVSAALLVRSFRNLMSTDPGFSTATVVKAEYQLPLARYPRDFAKWPNQPEIVNFNNTLLERAASIPGVQSAAIAGAHPLDPGFTNSWLIVGREGEASTYPEISVRIVSPRYVETVGSALARGRELSDADDGHAPLVAMINETAAKRYFANREALGAQIAFWCAPRTIVGIIRDERIKGLREPVPAAIYVPLAQAPLNSGVLLVRTERPAESMAGELQRTIWSVDPQLAVYGVEPMSRTILRSVSASRFAMIVLGVFSGVTVLLALIGVHGVVSYLVAQRTKEIGIRVALGAGRGTVTGLVVRSGLTLGAIGVGIGAVGAWALSRLLGTLLYGVTRADAVSFITVSVGMLVAASLSAYLPARRASRVSPLVAIRSD